MTYKEQADIKRAEAKLLLNSAFGWGIDICNSAVDKAVDCIIDAAILEISAICKAENESNTTGADDEKR